MPPSFQIAGKDLFSRTKPPETDAACKRQKIRNPLFNCPIEMPDRGRPRCKTRCKALQTCLVCERFIKGFEPVLA